MSQQKPENASASPGSSGRKQERISRTVPYTLLAQSALTIVLSLLGWLLGNQTVALSLFLGGMTAVIPNAFLAARMLGPGANASAANMLRLAWVGEIGKLLLTALLFGAIFALIKPVSAVAVIGSYMATQLVILGALFADGRAGMNATTDKS